MMTNDNPGIDNGLELTNEGSVKGKRDRKFLRIPVAPGLVIFKEGQKTYPVHNLSMYGVGISINDPTVFEIGDILEKVRIEFTDRFFSVDTRVVHISLHNDGKTLICGMEIVNTYDAGYIDWMTRVISEMK